MQKPALLFLLVTLLLAPAPASAQNTNPPPDPDCGLPKGLSGARRIYSDVTWTLTADCQQAWRLVCGTSTQGAQKITITVNGGGHTISAFQDAQGYLDVFSLTGNCAISLNNVTINGGGYQGRAAIQLTSTDYPSSFSDVTFTNTYYAALSFDDQRENNSPGTTHTLGNVLIENTTGSYAAVRHGIPSAIQAIGTVNLNINNLALRNVRGGNSAIGANDTFIVNRTVSPGTIALTGCLTVDGVFPRVIYGNYVDNSTGPCGTVGNNGSAAMQYPQAPASPCGLPLGGFIYGTQVYNLNSDCAMSGRLYIPYESEVVINGNGHSLVGAALAIAGPTRLSNVVISGASDSPVVTWLDREISIADATFRNNAGPLHFQDSIVTLYKVLIENHSPASAANPGAVRVDRSARVPLGNTISRGNPGGVGALHAGASFVHGNPATTLLGSTAFEGNSPVDIVDPDGLLIDSRTEPCPDFVIPRPPGSETGSYASLPPASGCNVEDGALPIGSVACVFRHDGVLAVYRIDEQSRGHFSLAVTQAQADANGAGMIAASPDDWSSVAVMEDGKLVISVGPDHEGKVLNVTLDAGVHGRGMGPDTTWGEPPVAGSAAGGATSAHADVPSNCMVTTQYILNLRESPGGAIMRHLPFNVTLTVTDRAAGWLEVDYHGERGWISADHVSPNGDCDPS
ncbi:MAG: SH3 domain-containing protein [Anaerolineaceae bacterium]|nr:SH3 domain-containing protein [Anaerolineaceae bacterium]